MLSDTVPVPDINIPNTKHNNNVYIAWDVQSVGSLNCSHWNQIVV